MSGQQRESAYALVVLGNQGVGKSSLCLRYTTNEFPESHMETPWVDTYDKHIDIGKSKKSRKRVHLRIYDTAGQEEMAALWESHLRNKDSVLLVISISDRESVARAAKYYSSIDSFLRKQFKEKYPKLYTPELRMPILLAANKCDLEKSDPSQVQVTREDIIKQVGVKENQIIYTSAKEGIRVSDAFRQAVELIPGALPSKENEPCSIC